MPSNRKLGKTSDQRMAMLRQQVTDLLDTGRMETTVTRAKEIAPLAEKMITLGKNNNLANYRQALSFITREDVAKKLFEETASKYADRNGGYTRVIKLGNRQGDGASMSIFELVGYEGAKAAKIEKQRQKREDKAAKKKKEIEEAARQEQQQPPKEEEGGEKK